MDRKTSFEYVNTLKGELGRRIGANARYSQRAFARDLGISQGRLSLIFRGKQGLSNTSASRIAHRLGLSPRETELFIAEVEAAHGRSPTKRQGAQKRLKSMQAIVRKKMSLQTFYAISDWRHMAVLEALKVDHCEGTPTWLATFLGMKEVEAETILNRLLSLGLVSWKNGIYSANSQTLSGDDVPSAAIRQFHQGILDSALRALSAQSMTERENRVNILKFDSSRVTEAVTKIRRFIEEFDSEFGQGKGDSVYCTALQFFKLSHMKGGDTK